eukprot:m.32350 g.32350  ORF g.32350 m.32350 type:complete len:1233 (-) comp4987_c0_seq1:52-3750(-)
MAAVKVGQRVLFVSKNLKATVRFYGDTKFAPGKWVGIELDEAEGKNNGSVQGEKYFDCADNHGMFVKPEQIKALPAEKTPAAKPAAPAAKATGSASKLPLKPGVKPSSSSGSLTRVAASSASLADEPSPAPAVASPPAEASPPATTPTPGPATPAKAAPAAIPSIPTPSAPTPAAHTPAAHTPAVPTPAVPMPVLQVSSTYTAAAEAVAKAAPLPSLSTSYFASRSSEAERIEVLESAAQRDAARIAELEDYRAQVLQVQELKATWQATQDALQAQLTEAAKTHMLERDKLAAKATALNEMYELASVDKEIAEERARQAEEETIAHKSMIDALKTQVDALKAENAAAAAAVAQSPAVLDLTAQNNRMKGALLKLKAEHDAVCEEFSAANDMLNEQRATIFALRHQLEDKTAALARAENFVAQAKSKLSATSESVLEKLMHRNVLLEDHMKRLTEEREDLISLVQVDDELEDRASNSEKEAKTVLQVTATRFGDMQKAIEILHRQNEEYRTTIAKFREKVASLEGETSALKGREEEMQNEATAQKKMEAQMGVAKATAARYRERAEVAAKKLSELSISQSAMHISLLKTYLPDSMFALDHECIRLLLLLTRIQAKGEIVDAFILEQFRLEEDVPRLVADGELTVDQVAFAADTRCSVRVIIVQAQYLLKAIGQAKVNVFQGFASAAGELGIAESALDGILKAIQSDGLDPSGAYSDLRAGADALLRVATERFKENDRRKASQQLHDTVTPLLASSEAVLAQLEAIRALVRLGNEGGLELPLEGMVSFFEHTVEPRATALKQASRKILRKLPDEREITINLDSGLLFTVADSSRQLWALAGVVRATLLGLKASRYSSAVHKALTYESTVQTAVSNRLDPTEDGEHTSKALGLGADEALAPIHMSALLDRAGNNIATIAETLSNGGFDAPAPPPEPSVEPPWEVRATEIRASLTDTLGLGDKLEDKENEMKEVRHQLKLREKELAEYMALADTATRRGEAVKDDFAKELRRVQADTEAVREQLASKDAELAETIAALEGEIRAVEAERNSWRQKAEAQPQRRGARFASEAGLQAAAEQIDVLQQALSASRAECSRLRARDIHAQLADLPAIAVPTVAAAPPVEKAALDASTLYRQIQLAAATAAVVDVTHIVAKAPRVQLAATTVQETAFEIQARHVRDAAAKILSAQPERSASHEAVRTVGTVRFPPSATAAAGRFPLALTPLQFASVHAFVAS